MIDVAIQREQALWKEAKNNPHDFLQHASLSSERDTFPEEVKKHIEQEVNIQGETVRYHSDEFNERKRNDYISLQTGNESYVLFANQNTEDIATGSNVNVEGIALGPALAARNLRIESSPQQKNISIANETKIAIFALKFEDDPVEKYSTSQINTLLFSGNSSISEYYKASSYGKLHITGDVFGYFSISRDSAPCNKDNVYVWTDTWADQADQAAKKSGINLNQYYSIVYLIPPNHTCPAIGWGEVGKPKNHPSRTWIDGREYYDKKGTYLHELGHNLGIDHANYAPCKSDWNERNYGSDTLYCKNNEYGDIYDVMGNFWAKGIFDLNAPHKHALGFIKYDLNNYQIFDATVHDQPTIINILPAENTPVSGPFYYTNNAYTATFVRLNNIGGSVVSDVIKSYPTYYYIEYRQPIDIDASLPKQLTEGILIHQWNPNFPDIQSELVNPHLGDTNSVDANENVVLLDGETFEDRLSGFKLTQLSHDQTKATLKLEKIPYSNSTKADISVEIYDEFKACFGKTTKDNPPCQKFDKNGNGRIDEDDYKRLLEELNPDK